MASTISKIVTYEEWLRMPVTKRKEEVVDGEIITMPPPIPEHAFIIEELNTTFVLQLDRKVFRILSSVFGLLIRQQPLRVREPDLAVFIRKNIVIRDGLFCSPPELLVEVLSPSNTRKEMAQKIEDYESIGVPEFWILSPEARNIEVLQLLDGKLRTTAIVNQGQLRPLRFPQAVVDVASIWPD